MDFLKYNFTGAQPYRESGFVKRVNNCNGFIAVNTGDEIAVVNDQVLYPGVPGTNLGDSKTVGGNAGEVFLGNIKITFNGGGANPEVTIDQKFYILEENIF